MLNFAERHRALQRTSALFERENATLKTSLRPVHQQEKTPPSKGLALLIHQAGLALSPRAVLLLTVFSSVTFVALTLEVVAPVFLPVVALAGALIPLTWLEKRIKKRAAEFASDYPSVLLAMSSNMKAGMTPYDALARAIHLLPVESLVRIEVRKLLERLERGENREVAIGRFASNVRQPELELFRNGFSLVLENGGQFTPTLERLATVSNDRSLLIRSANVSTANMRMTANLLLAITPIVLFIISIRSDQFWSSLFEHPIANLLGTSGFLLIFAGYATLRRMSDFQP